MSSIRDHNLGSKLKFDPGKLFNEDQYRETDALVVSLALIFNDIKGLVLFISAFEEVAPSTEDGPTSAKVGQYSGIQSQIIRYKIGIFRELLMLLKEKKDLLSTEIIKRAYNKMDGSAQTNWDQIKFIAIENKMPDSMKQFKTAFIKMRNHGAFHYYQTDPIAEGYEYHFSKDAPTSKNAYLSKGKTLEETRFYFADAAISGLYEKWIDEMKEPNFFQVLENYIKLTHSSIRSFVISYLAERGVELILEP